MTLIHQNSPTCLCCHILPTFSGQGPRVPSKSSKAKASPPNQAPGHKTKCFHSPVSGVTATELRPGLLRDTQAGKSPAAESSTHPEGCTIWLLPFTSSAVLSCLSLQMKTYLHFFFFSFLRQAIIKKLSRNNYSESCYSKKCSDLCFSLQNSRGSDFPQPQILLKDI